MRVTDVFSSGVSGFRVWRVFAVLLLLCLFTGKRVYSAPKTVLVLGDSLSAEYGLKRNTGWVRLLDNRLKKVIRASGSSMQVSAEKPQGVGKRAC